jgi:hypothetical protein
MSRLAESRHLTTMKAVWTALGGVLGVAELLGLEYNVVENWKRARNFPARLHFAMTRALKRKGLTARPELWGQVVLPEMDEAA